MRIAAAPHRHLHPASLRVIRHGQFGYHTAHGHQSFAWPRVRQHGHVGAVTPQRTAHNRAQPASSGRLGGRRCAAATAPGGQAEPDGPSTRATSGPPRRCRCKVRAKAGSSGPDRRTMGGQAQQGGALLGPPVACREWGQVSPLPAGPRGLAVAVLRRLHAAPERPASGACKDVG